MRNQILMLLYFIFSVTVCFSQNDTPPHIPNILKQHEGYVEQHKTYKDNEKRFEEIKDSLLKYASADTIYGEKYLYYIDIEQKVRINYKDRRTSDRSLYSSSDENYMLYKIVPTQNDRYIAFIFLRKSILNIQNNANSLVKIFDTEGQAPENIKRNTFLSDSIKGYNIVDVFWDSTQTGFYYGVYSNSTAFLNEIHHYDLKAKKRKDTLLQKDMLLRKLLLEHNTLKYVIKKEGKKNKYIENIISKNVICLKPRSSKQTFQDNCLSRREAYKVVNGDSQFVTFFYANDFPLKKLKQKNNHILVYVYGGFNLNPLDMLSPFLLAWISTGGIVAVPELSGDKGRHEQGKGLNKQNTFDDIDMLAEYLIRQKHTTNKRMVIYGVSNGGLTANVALTQRPQKWAAVISENGLSDMTRYDLLGGVSKEWKETEEYGLIHVIDSTNIEEIKRVAIMMAYVLGYSPLDNLHPNTAYPATLIICSLFDNIVPPEHSINFIEKLEKLGTGASEDGLPHYILYTQRGAHNKKIMDEEINKYAFMYLFIFQKLDISPKFGKYKTEVKY